MLASPNNPTARPIRSGDLAGLLELAPERPVLLDETYAEFCGQNFIPWIERFPNLIILRTLSKSRGLPGLRCGFIIGNPAVVSSLNTLRSPYNLTATAAWVGSAVLAGDTNFRERLAAATAARADLQRELARLGVPVWPSATHFCLLYLGGAAGSAASALAEQSILVRTLDDDLSGFIRVSVTGPDDVAGVLSAFTPWLSAAAAPNPSLPPGGCHEVRPRHYQTTDRRTSVSGVLSGDSFVRRIVTPIPVFSLLSGSIGLLLGLGLELDARELVPADDPHLVEDTALAVGDALTGWLGDRGGRRRSDSAGLHG